ncbi:MAG: DUF6778 family protein [Sulfitobacter sp.]
MKILKLIAALGLGATVSACSTMPDIASRNIPFEVTPTAVAPSVPTVATPTTLAPTAVALTEPAHLQSQVATPLRVAGINVTVPQQLVVSEANSYYPNADIVWRGDPVGNRYTQVQTIFETAFQAGTAQMNGPTDVTLEVELTRFHSVTEKTRYSVGGVHNMVFNLTVRRASTGEILAPKREVRADLPALGGRAAIEADRIGQTQKVRVTDFLAQVIQQELKRYISS